MRICSEVPAGRSRVRGQDGNAGRWRVQRSSGLLCADIDRSVLSRRCYKSLVIKRVTAKWLARVCGMVVGTLVDYYLADFASHFPDPDERKYGTILKSLRTLREVPAASSTS